MGLFSKKPNRRKLYTLQEAMSFISGNEGYSVVQEGNGYRIIPDSEANKHIDIYKSQSRQREEFSQRLQTGYTSAQIKQGKNSSYTHKYGYYEEER